MCLGGGQTSYPQPKFLSREDPPPGPPSPPDMVNEMEIKPTGDFSRKNNLKAKPKVTQSSKNPGMY
tara:strand:+ start:588 stop:785 length:198 start_codon:yes stop_codon:yes gene_type:complete